MTTTSTNTAISSRLMPWVLATYNASGLMTESTLLTIVRVKALPVMSKYKSIHINVIVSDLIIYSQYLKYFNNAAKYFEWATGCDTVRNL